MALSGVVNVDVLVCRRHDEGQGGAALLVPLQPRRTGHRIQGLREAGAEQFEFDRRLDEAVLGSDRRGDRRSQTLLSAARDMAHCERLLPPYRQEAVGSDPWEGELV